MLEKSTWSSDLSSTEKSEKKNTDDLPPAVSTFPRPAATQRVPGEEQNLQELVILLEQRQDGGAGIERNTGREIIGVDNPAENGK